MENCIFCKIVNKEIPADIIYENDDIISFKDLYPKADKHLLVIPKKHIATFLDIKLEDKELISKLMYSLIDIVKENAMDEGYKTLINTGKKGGQEVFHLHIHLLYGTLRF